MNAPKKPFHSRPLAILSAAALIFAAVQSATAADVTIGQLTQLTGYGAEGFGRPTNWGGQVAIAKLKGSPLLGGNTINFVLADDASDPTTGITEMNKMTRQRVSIFTESAISRICSALAPIAAQTKPPSLIMCIGSSGTGAGDTKPEFAYMNDPNGPFRSLAKHVVEKKGAKKIAVIFDADNAGSFDSQSGYFLAGLKAVGVNDYVSVQKISIKDTDFSSVLTNLKALAPDAITFFATAAQSGNIIRQMVQMGGFEKVLNIGHIGWNTQVPQIAGSAATGAVFPQAWIPNDGAKDFIEAYKKIASGAMPTAYSALGHDAIYLLSIAARMVAAEGKQPDGPSVVAKLAAAAQSDDYKANALAKGLSFNALGRPQLPGGVATFSKDGAIVPAE